ncbi:hypothetical protein XAP412_230064 [Xanthomonas phaseoli pv. phaseoli]|uniref:Uncharacterized protein n=1 Tax=Xanthomonas campestris pv. phaseoli TaxID=317013 RepID=A0AB38DXZ5_XANCH|nr:hypothetical protein XAP6984_300065 [Xanthomonas phaseoli pv. phaseoli]SON81941.1 hypothetical protein XAP412_230064 [Xanthomonas phaseoli pv. phaseoli]SON86015.1 hypothetical protein XAP7430_250065 [Xanthomonas phaseoli pv. phaseoli]SOO32301.1 hypothetical protein XAP6164_890028 [Xanthomonas phaseoli pv. phaseoli]
MWEQGSADARLLQSPVNVQEGMDVVRTAASGGLARPLPQPLSRRERGLRPCTRCRARYSSTLQQRRAEAASLPGVNGKGR